MRGKSQLSAHESPKLAVICSVRSVETAARCPRLRRANLFVHASPISSRLPNCNHARPLERVGELVAIPANPYAAFCVGTFQYHAFFFGAHLKPIDFNSMRFR